MKKSGGNENLMKSVIAFRDREQKNGVEKFRENTIFEKGGVQIGSRIELPVY